MVNDEQSSPISEATTPAVSSPPKRDGEVTNVKETIESILVAFILAFIFRAFVVEAFVIPTGSMAPTLLGAHIHLRCPDCGYQFDTNYEARTEQDSEDMRVPELGYPTGDVYCPNCGFRVAGGQQPDPPQPVRFGDRILVLKYIYLLQSPQRWDVVVFKSPDTPEKYHYQQNYIKRLVGLPGERLMALDGDLYAAPLKDPNNWHILTKPRSAQEAVWRLVYDNDYYPQHPERLSQFGVTNWKQPWEVADGSGWNLGTSSVDGRTFKFDGSEGGSLHFNPNANGATQSLTDYLVYDTGFQRRRSGSIGSADDDNANAVSDVKLTTYYTRQSGEGPLRLKLSRHEEIDHTFTAEITPDAVRLLHWTKETGEQEVRNVKLADLGIRPNAGMLLEFQNVDYRVSLRINGKDAFESLDYPPDVPWLMEQWRRHRRGRSADIEMEAARQTCTLQHVSLYRDVYYTSQQAGPFIGIPSNPVELHDGEYFVMGDNSFLSRDARYWDTAINLPQEGLDMPGGRVPAQFMLGKAVFVYWPAGYHLLEMPLSIVPNFGDMRWIH